MAAPKWFEYQTYFNNKLAEMQDREPEKNWDAASLKEGMAEAGFPYTPDGMYAHFEEWGNTVDENLSPSQWFDVNTYMANKLAQLKTLDAGTYGDYTVDDVARAFKEDGLTAWDHYTLYGMGEGVSPSNGFDTSAYMEAKLAQLKALDAATYGDWTVDDVVKAFEDDGLNPIMHYELYGIDENLEQYGYVPAEVQELTTGRDTLALGDTNAVLDAVVGNSKVATLNDDDQITGGAGQDTLRVDMQAKFDGFGADGFMKNVETVDLDNTSTKDLSFSAANMEGVRTWNIDGNVSLSGLDAAGITVNLANADSSKGLTIGFAADAVNGGDDALTLGVNNVVGASDAAVAVTAAGIENLTVNAQGATESVLDLGKSVQVENLAVLGEGALKVTAVGTALENIDASAATGKLNLDASAATQLESATLGSADDRLTVTNIAIDAAIDGGAGQDELVLDAVTNSALELNMTNVETMTVKDNTAALVLAGGNTSGLETIKLDTVTNAVTVAEFSNSQINIDVVGSNTGAVTVSGIEDVTLNVGDKDKTADSYTTGTITLADATVLTVNVAQDGTFTGGISGEKLTDLNLNNSNTNADTLKLGTSSLDALTDLTVSGFGAVDVSSASIGAQSDSLTVDASGLKADFKASFTANKAEDSELSITGTRLGKNDITVDDSYASIEVTGGIQDDEVNLGSSISAATNDAPQSLTVDLGLGNNVVKVGGDFRGWTLDVSNTEIALQGDTKFDANINNLDGVKITGSSDIEIFGSKEGDTFNLTGLDVQSTGDVVVHLDKNDTITLGSAAETMLIDSGASAQALNIKFNGFDTASDSISFASDGFLNGLNWGTTVAINDASASVSNSAASASTSASVSASASVSIGSLADGSIYFLESYDAANAADVAGVFASVSSVEVSNSTQATNKDDSVQVDVIASLSGLYLDSGDSVMLAVADGSGNTNLWFIQNDSNAKVEANEVFLVGTLNGVESITTDIFA